MTTPTRTEPATTEPSAGVPLSAWRQRALRFAPLAVLVLLILGVSLVEPSFLRPGSLRVLGEEAAVILLLATGQTLVILLGGIDLSNAALASLATVILALLLPGLGIAAVILVLLFCSLAGAVQGYVHVKAQVPSFIVTLGGMGLWGGLALTLSGASTIVVRENYAVIGWMVDRVFGVPIVVLVAIVFVGIMVAVLRTTSFGRRLYALGVAEPVAILSGVRVARVKTTVFALGGLFAGLAALLIVARLRSAGPTVADALLLPGIAAVIVGGTAITGGVGGVGRTAIGALILTVLRVGMNVMGVDAAYQQIVYGVLIIAAVAATFDRSKIAIVK